MKVLECVVTLKLSHKGITKWIICEMPDTVKTKLVTKVEQIEN